LKKASLIVFGVCLAALTFYLGKTYLANRPLVYHGSSVNAAVEERNDRWWKDARLEVQQRRRPGYIAHTPVFYHGDPALKEVALTFDDGPHPGKVQKLLAILRQLDLKATFFVVGKMAEKHPELVRMEAAAGNEIADHSFSHVNLSKLPADEVEIEYLACKNLIQRITGKAPRFCRPPGGRATEAVVEGAEKCGLITTMWSDDPKDYSNPGSDQIESDLLDHVTNGGILLLHEGVEETMQVLPDIVRTLRASGFKMVTVSQLMEDSVRTFSSPHRAQRASL